MTEPTDKKILNFEEYLIRKACVGIREIAEEIDANNEWFKSLTPEDHEYFWSLLEDATTDT